MPRVQNIVDLIERTATPGTVIPKPEARADFVVKRWGRRRGERALVYTIPNHRDEQRPYEKGIAESEWLKAYDQLTATGQFTRKWFQCEMIECNTEGGCNFTTIGGIFELLGIATYAHRGTYIVA